MVFGERTFSGQTPGIANANIDGRLVLRPYGTFPHPNVLAGYLTIVLTMVISNLQFPISNKIKIFFIATLVLGTIGVFLTMSRITIALWVFMLVYWIVIYLKKQRKIYLLIVLVLICLLGYRVISFTPLLSRFTSMTTTDESVQYRYRLNLAAIEMVRSSPLLGVGLNNFLVRLPEFYAEKHAPRFLWLQPAHNIYLLIAAEVGIPGLIFFLWFVGKTFQRIKEKQFSMHNSKFTSLFTVLFLGLFDHYFLTLQQGQLLLALVLGLCWIKQGKH